MTTRRWPIALALAAFGAWACNALNGSGDLTFGDDDPDAGPEASPPNETGPPMDANIDANDGAARPSFCSGIVFYARFDGTLVSSEGYPAITPTGAPPFDAGKFGGSVELGGDASGLFGTSTDAAAVFYPANGPLLYPAAEGTVAFWFKPTWALAAATRSYFKPSADQQYTTSNTAGPQLTQTARNFQLTNNNPDATATASVNGKDVFHDLAWNHFAGSWRRSPPLLAISVNAQDEAGARDETMTAWEPLADASFVRLASANDPPDGQFDDVAIWNRVLSPEEIHAIASSPIPLGDVCGL